MTFYMIRYNTDLALQADLPRIMPLLRRAAVFGGADYSTENAYNLMRSGRADVYSGWWDDELCAVAICHVQDRGNKPSAYNVYALVSSAKLTKEMYLQGLGEFAERARQLGCKTMEMYTLRDKAFERVLEPYGWKPDVTRFVKEV